MSGVEVRPLSRLRTIAGRPPGGRHLWIVAGLIVLAVAAPAVVGVISGSILAAHNDDFAYRRAAIALYQTGHFQLTGWAVMTLVGLLVATQPLLWLAGGGPLAFAATTAVFGVIAIVASYSLARRVLSPGLAGFAVLLMELLPGFMLYTTAYMTEVPAIALEMACLAIGAAALQRSPAEHRWAWLVASLTVGCYAFSIRDYALAAPIAVLVTAAASERRGRTFPYAVAAVAVVTVCLAIYRYSASLPGQEGVGLQAPTPETVRRVLDAVGPVAFTLSPALLIALRNWIPHWWRSPRRRDALLGATAGMGVAAIVNLDRLLALIGAGPRDLPPMFVGNVFTQFGSLGPLVFAGDRPLLYPTLAWDVLNGVAMAAAFVALAFLGAFLVAERRRLLDALDVGARPTCLGSPTGMLAVFAVVFAAGTILLGVTVILFDRYTWPLVLPLAVLLLVRPDPRPAVVPAGRETGVLILSGALVALIATTSMVLFLNAAAFDSARWRMGDAAVRLGFAAETVDAGLEWVGFHATGLARLAAPGAPSMTEYAVKFPSFHQCAVASSTPLDFPGFTLILTQADGYRLLLFAGPTEPMYLYRVAREGCPLGR
ncbi:MAG: glycosyltransferase family 39 protein [Chloroflexota bacterium]